MLVQETTVCLWVIL